MVWKKRRFFLHFISFYMWKCIRFIYVCIYLKMTGLHTFWKRKCGIFMSSQAQEIKKTINEWIFSFLFFVLVRIGKEVESWIGIVNNKHRRYLIAFHPPLSCTLRTKIPKLDLCKIHAKIEIKINKNKRIF